MVVIIMLKVIIIMVPMVERMGEEAGFRVLEPGGGLNRDVVYLWFPSCCKIGLL